jgi:CheY-like chemotaxis protein
MRCVDQPFSAATALVVDDDCDLCRILELALASAGCKATTVGSAQGAIALFADHAFPVVFVDARLPDMDGWRLIEELRRLRPEIGIIMISGYYFEDDVRVAKALRASEIDGFLAKPFRVEAVVAMVAALGADGHRRPIRSGGDTHLALKPPHRGSPRFFLCP